MKNISRLTLWPLCAVFFSANSAWADAITVNITGNVIAAPCTIDGATSQDVKLDDIVVSKLQKAGDTGTAKSFDLKLKDCPDSTSRVTASYTGTVSPLYTDSFINTGTAGQLALWLKDSANATILPNSTKQAVVDSKTKTATFTQTVQVYSKGSATPGTVIGNIVVSFTYQ